MTIEEKIARINELYHKQKTEGLSPEELAEQAALRQDYVASIRNNLGAQLESMVVVGPDGVKRKVTRKNKPKE